MDTQRALPDGALTESLYKLISEQQFNQAIAFIVDLLQSRLNPPDQKVCYPLLSVLAYCLYMAEDFQAAGEIYNQLFEAFPAVKEYQLYSTYCSIQCGICGDDPSAKVGSSQKLEAVGICSPNRSKRVHSAATCSIPTSIPNASRSQCAKLALTPLDTALFESAALYQRGSFEEGRRVASAANAENGWTASVAYNEALCAYKSGDKIGAARIAGKIVSVCFGKQTEVVGGVGGSQHWLTADKRYLTRNPDTQFATLKALVAAANLCCAVDVVENRLRAANEHLLLLSSSSLSTSDYVTLHNRALTLAASDPAECIRILASLLDEHSVYKTAVGNLLILYCKQGHFAAAEKLVGLLDGISLGDLDEYETEFLRSFTMVPSSPLEARRRLESLETQMRQQIRELQEHRLSPSCSAASSVERTTANALQELIERLIPVLVALAKLYNAEGMVAKAELLLGSYGSLCSDNTYWKINMGHILFMQKKYDKCLSFYEDSVRKDVPGHTLERWEVVALSNALVANILLGHLDRAQQLLNLLNASEQPDSRSAPFTSGCSTSIPHCSVVKLIVGTLYCAEKAYEYGLRTVLESLDPIEKVLNAETWGYCKACIGSLLTDVALGNFVLDYQLKRTISAVLLRIENKAINLPGKHPLTGEARALRRWLTLFA